VSTSSNGIRFSISDLAPPRTRLITAIYRERADISLFDALNSTGKSASEPLTFPDGTIARVAETLARFRYIADQHGVPPGHISVLATEAMRRAANAAAMLDAIREEANIGVHVLTPQVETLFGAVMGSRAAFTDISRGGLFLDLGGGSVQLTWVDTRLPVYEVSAALAGESMPFGAARLIHVLEAEPESVRTREESKLRASMQDAVTKLSSKFPALRALMEAASHTVADGEGNIDVYLCGGGFRGYGSMLMYDDSIQPYPIPSVGAYTVSGKLFKQTKRMLKLNDAYEGKIYGMSKRRRRQFPAIVAVVNAFVDVVPNIRTATFCSGSNRDGSLMMKLPKSIRESNPLEVLAGISNDKLPVVQAVLKSLYSAVPVTADISKTATIFSLSLGQLFTTYIWAREGDNGDSNASYALHHAVTRDPLAPGLTHLARAVLGLTVCARWGSNLGPIDVQLYQSLRELATRSDLHVGFWADYIGAVAAVMAILVPVWPKDSDEIEKAVRLVVIPLHSYPELSQMCL
jgi:retrograde regulation protein 2